MAPTLTFNPGQIRALRAGLGLTQQAFADRVGVTKQAISLWEAGRSEPTVEHLLRIVNATGARLEVFFQTAERPS